MTDSNIIAEMPDCLPKCFNGRPGLISRDNHGCCSDLQGHIEILLWV
jgi:hypothetical protein